MDRRRSWPWARRSLRAGDRAPDVAFTTTSGVATLFELMASARPVVLFDGVGDETTFISRLRALHIDAYAVSDSAGSRSPASATTLVDAHGDFAALYGVGRNYVCLIRPDGHVGLILDAADHSSLQQYLARICDTALVSDVFLQRAPSQREQNRPRRV